ncbi:MAG: hypothetical protein WC455_21455 [Dehalococcoidia bacterium]|jgi:hypothetical protein
MRRQLQPFLGCKYPFSATVDAFGLRKMPYRGAEPTVCLRDVLLHVPGSVIVPIDHVWANVGKTFARFNPRKGDRISFNAWVREYYKYNYNTGEDKLDYCIDRMSRLDFVERNFCGSDFVTFWALLKRSKKFISDVPFDLIAGEKMAATGAV